MGIFADLFKKKTDANGKAVGNVEDFVSLTRVYSNVCLRYRPRAANWDWAKKALPAKC